MLDWLELIVLILVCYRLSRLIAIDEGPFSIFLKLRVKLGAYDYGNNGQAQSNLGRGINCPHCIGLWIALPLALIASGIQWHTLLYWFAIAGGQSFLWSLTSDS